VTDTALQDLRRRARQDPTLEPQLLTARVRAGELTQERLELAGLLGHEPALKALGWVATPGWPGPFLTCLMSVHAESVVERFGKEALCRVAQAIMKASATQDVAPQLTLDYMLNWGEGPGVRLDVWPRFLALALENARVMRLANPGAAILTAIRVEVVPWALGEAPSQA